MCWQIAIPLIASAAGAAIQHKQQTDLLGSQEREAAANILKQAEMNREADSRVSQAVQQVNASNPDAERNAKRTTYLDALRKSMGVRAGAVPVNGAVSDRFANDASAAAADAESEAEKQAALTADIEAPAYQRQNEGVILNNANADLNMIRNRAQGQDYLSKLRMALMKPNQWMTAGGQLLSGAGGALAAGGGYGMGSDPFGATGLDPGFSSGALSNNAVASKKLKPQPLQF